MKISLIVARGLLVAVLWGMCVLKVFGGHKEGVSVATGLFWLAGVVEAVAALLICGLRWRVGCHMIVILAAAGVAHGLATTGRECGCMGKWIELGGRGEAVVAAMVGILAALPLMLGAGSKRVNL